MKEILHKGQIQLSIAIVGAIATVCVGTFTAYATSNVLIYDVKARVDVVEERENNHYLEMQKTLERIESKLDTITTPAPKTR